MTTEWPNWWSWEIELSTHVLKRMSSRSFNEVELRSMLQDSSEYHRDVEIGRWVIEATHDGRSWEVIVEPSVDEQVLIVITAYPVEPS